MKQRRSIAYSCNPKNDSKDQNHIQRLKRKYDASL